jgi:soluble lytic murein transglycosylase-like protein
MGRLFILLASCALAQAAAAEISPREALRLAIEKQRASAARQREAVRIQAENAGVLLPPDRAPIEEEAAPPAVSANPFPCEPLAEDELAPLIEQAAKAQELDAVLIRAVIEQESALRPCAVSPKGAQGLMQLMPATVQQFGVKDPFDPRENVFTGARLLKQHIEKYKGDVKLALGAYNAGPGAVDQAGGIPDFAETREYVRAILEKVSLRRTGPQSSPTPKPTEN